MSFPGIVALFLVVAAGCLAQGAETTLTANPETESSRLAAVADLGKRLLVAQNDAGLHVQMALAYFRRGALEDATRVTRHVRRALELDPFLEESTHRALATAVPGLLSVPLGPESVAVDEKVSRTIPEGSASGHSGESSIQSGLASRIAKSHFRSEPQGYKEGVADYRRTFELDANSAAQWRERADKLRRAPRAATGIDGVVTDRIMRAVRTAMRDDPPPEEPQGDAVPDPMTIKNLPLVAYLKGDVERAMDYLMRTAAASRELLRRQSVDRPQVAPRRELTVSTPTRQTEVRLPPPDRTVEVPAPGADSPPDRDLDRPAQGGAEAPPRKAPPSPPTRTGSGAPPREQPPGTPPRAGSGTPEREPPPEPPPDRTRQVGETALEGGEAMRNNSVPPSEVVRKLRELTQIGLVGEPLLVDLDGDGRPGVAGGLMPDGRLEPSATVLFDLDADGRKEWVEWLLPNRDGLLACDLDGDGRIASGRELFGDLHGHADGFSRLATWDVDRDGLIRGAEANGLVAWRDDGDGKCVPDEAIPLSRLGIVSITLPAGADRTRSVCATAAGTIAIWEWWPDIR